ncbi:unnamed protein product [Cuscuta epithymum]|nr:unnamed protein product [Cuscuta epithymum]
MGPKKYPSGHDKLLKRRKIEKLTLSQKGALDKFIIKEAKEVQEGKQAVKLLKNYLRSTMSQERLNGLALISIEHETLQEIDIASLVDDFASKYARRMSLFK